MGPAPARALSQGMPDSVLGKILFAAACLLLPIVWGVLVNWLFNLWNGRKTETDADAGPDNDDWGVPDYQI